MTTLAIVGESIPDTAAPGESVEVSVTAGVSAPEVVDEVVVLKIFRQDIDVKVAENSLQVPPVSTTFSASGRFPMNDDAVPLEARLVFETGRVVDSEMFRVEVEEIQDAVDTSTEEKGVTAETEGTGESGSADGSGGGSELLLIGAGLVLAAIAQRRGDTAQ